MPEEIVLNTIPELLEDIREGRMVVLMDDEERENEGDLVMAASKVRPEDINFMARFGRGLICLPLTRERCQQLQLPLMVNRNQAHYRTNFTVSIEAAEGITTGISAYDRAHTIRTAVQPDAKAKDLSQPGHVFPLMYAPGGVLARAGHTEASVDLAMLAGMEPAAVLVEILNEDGSMARRPDLEVFAKEHGLKIGTIADLIHYRIANEKTVERVGECNLPTEFGDFRLIAYQDVIDNELHLALVLGNITPEEPTLVRVHMQSTICDLFAANHRACHWPLHKAMQRVSKEGKGVIVVLRNHDTSRELLQRMRDLQLHDAEDQVPARANGGNHLRTYGAGAQILGDLGVRRMRILSAPKSLHGISGFDLEVVEYVDFE